jgi:hypothetical protein
VHLHNQLKNHFKGLNYPNKELVLIVPALASDALVGFFAIGGGEFGGNIPCFEGIRDALVLDGIECLGLYNINLLLSNLHSLGRPPTPLRKWSRRCRSSAWSGSPFPWRA